MTGVRKDGSEPKHLWVPLSTPGPHHCTRCGQPVRAWHDDQQCGTPDNPCEVPWYLAPCGHQADARVSR